GSGVYLASDVENSSVVNSGAIQASGLSGIGVWIQGDQNTLVNEAGASITALGNNGVGVLLDSVEGQVSTVDNFGIIDGFLAAIGGATGSDSVSNYGEIGNSIVLLEGDDAVHNFGSIDGHVLLGEGNDIFTSGVGSTVTGVVDGGNGQDALQLDVSSGEEFVADTAFFDGFLNFENYTKTGEGTLSFSGEAPFSEFTVDQGLFNVNQDFAGDVFVGIEGTLGGSGTILGNVFNSGIINAGNSPGTLTVNGDVTFAAGSTFEVEFNVDTADLLLVSGVTTIEDDATLLLTPDGDNVFGIFTHEVLRSDGGILGDFTTVAAPNFAIVDTYFEGNSLFVDFITQLGAGVALGPQSGIVADYLNGRLVAGADAATLDVFTSLVSLDPATQLNAALGQLHPEAYAGTSSLSATASLSVVDALRDQLVVGRDAEKGHIDLWASGLGDFIDQDGQSGTGTSGFDIDSYGIVAGLSYGLSDSITVGALVGYQNLEQDFDGLNVESDVDNVFVGAYATAGISKFNVDAAFIYHTADVDTTRSISALNETAFGDYDLDAFTLSGRVGYEAFANDGWLIEPYAGLTYINSDRDDVREVGADGANLFVEGEETDFTFLDLGTRIVGQWAEGRVEPYVDLAWRYDLSDDANGATARFINESATFRVQGADVERSRAHIGAGLTGHITSKLKAYATYGGDFGSDISSHSFRTGVRYSF
ncbi:MAG: autotransporter domain-containing protein, partial [Sphingomonadales bacterium]